MTELLIILVAAFYALRRGLDRAERNQRSLWQDDDRSPWPPPTITDRTPR